jgi:ADP-ribosylglycohydrolase
MLKRFRGAVLGFAIGDALGMPVEGLKREEIKTIYGVVRDFMDSPLGDLKSGEWTDDTEQMILLAESILETTYFNPEHFAKKLVSLTSNRLGWTTKRALNNLMRGVHWFNAGVESETCGASVRVLPIGLVYSFSFDLVEKYSVMSASVTHRGIAVVGAVAYALAIAYICNDIKGEEMVKRVVKRVKMYDDLVADKIELAYEMIDEEIDRVIDRIGNSMSVYDSVPLAFYLYLSSPSFEECAVKSANVGGDTDSICAMACGLKGCELGVDSIPERWIEGLRDSHYLIELSDRLYDLRMTIEFGV